MLVAQLRLKNTQETSW